jgi:hypothetical protein
MAVLTELPTLGLVQNSGQEDKPWQL